MAEALDLNRKQALWLRKRTGLGVSGALNGAFVAACPASAGISLFVPVSSAAASRPS